jgi:hypothetical protein
VLVGRSDVGGILAISARLRQLIMCTHQRANRQAARPYNPGNAIGDRRRADPMTQRKIRFGRGGCSEELGTLPQSGPPQVRPVTFVDCRRRCFRAVFSANSCLAQSRSGFALELHPGRWSERDGHARPPRGGPRRPLNPPRPASSNPPPSASSAKSCAKRSWRHLAKSRRRPPAP